MLGSKGRVKSILWNEVSTVSASLRPCSVISVPVMVAILLQRGMALPSAMTCPTPLLLPDPGLFLRALRRRLLETLCLLRLLRLRSHLRAATILSLLRCALNRLLGNRRALLRLLWLRL